MEQLRQREASQDDSVNENELSEAITKRMEELEDEFKTADGGFDAKAALEEMNKRKGQMDDRAKKHDFKYTPLMMQRTEGVIDALENMVLEEDE